MALAEWHSMASQYRIGIVWVSVCALDGFARIVLHALG